jgi:hypothetical protein
VKRGAHINVVTETGKAPGIGHFVEASGDKDVVQLPDGTLARYARRDPADYDEQGGGQTWYPIGE